MNLIISNMYTPNEISLAHQLANALEDQKSLAFYLTCAKKYPKDFLLSTVNDVVNLPDYAIRTTRPRLFTNIVKNSVYSLPDRTWD